jgi:secreted trypsin-like serine protease
MIYSGAHDLLRFEPTRTMFTVAQVILHEHFDVNTFDNDIALLRLTRPISWSRNQSPVCLPPHNSEIPPGTLCTITGWGVSGE